MAERGRVPDRIGGDQPDFGPVGHAVEQRQNPRQHRAVEGAAVKPQPEPVAALQSGQSPVHGAQFGQNRGCRFFRGMTMKLGCPDAVEGVGITILRQRAFQIIFAPDQHFARPFGLLPAVAGAIAIEQIQFAHHSPS
ncbi:hypothetical protein SDC9_185930 [bioreactor metagenome]|uniref:Uncharacterized protein n=1 Tax=bioreactor metagenome TaxID=1076179 RepID=A0A645HIG8_9ZZZZ